MSAIRAITLFAIFFATIAAATAKTSQMRLPPM
jgi:hypothetical protein